MSIIHRRRFLHQTTALGAAAAGLSLSFDHAQPPQPRPTPADAPRQGRLPYRGPNVILVRFGGGVRRLETILEPARTYCPFVYHELYEKRGMLFPHVDIASAPGVVTSHGQGTLYLLTGRYDSYEDITHRPFADRFVPAAPTIFEYFREKYNIPAHQALIINGEDRINEEFYTFSNHHLFGIRYRSTVLSLYRFKTFLLREELAKGGLPERERLAKEQRLQEMENLDYRVENRAQVAVPKIDKFWDNWRSYYGTSGLVNPRGDRLLTTLALRALRELKPRLLMINYQDPDYVHWGNPHFYTRAISIIDDGIRQIYDAAQAQEGYRDNTVFVVAPDCGRDANRCMPVPFQHHFNTRSAHEVFAVVAGPRRHIGQHGGRPVDRMHTQISVARTIGQIMGFETPQADGNARSLLG